VRFEKFSYLYPPRPEAAVPLVMLPYYEERGYIAQIKKNGTQNVLAVSPDREIIAMTRHKTEHKMWQPDEITAHAFNTLTGGWYVFVSELLHNKVAIGPKHTNYINDILVADGEYLVGTTFQARQDLLRCLFPDAVPHISGGYLVIDEITWLATNYRSNFSKITRKGPEDEGLVLKKSSAKLAICLKPNSNVNWQAKSYF
jgi:hypothetical protein